MKPFHTIDAVARGLSLGLPSNSDARMARSSEAKISDQSAPKTEFRAKYSGLMPSGSRQDQLAFVSVPNRECKHTAKQPDGATSINAHDAQHDSSVAG